MRARHLILGWSVLPVLSLAFFACVSNNAAPPAGEDASFSEQDAGAPDTAVPEAASGTDAPVAAADAPTEAAPVDASVDSPVDAAPPVLTVIVGGPTGLEQGVSVVWSDATGAVIETTTTGSNGATFTAATNVSMATAVLGSPSSPALYTVQGVQLGQSILVADVVALKNGPSLTAEVTSVPTAPELEDTGTLQYSLLSGTCGGPTSIPDEFGLGNGADEQPCLGLYESGSSFDVAFPVLVEADNSSGKPLGFAFSNDNSLATPDDAGIYTVALANPWETAFTQQTLTVSGTDDAGQSPTLAFSEVADGVLSPLSQHAATLEDGGAAPGVLVYTHPGFATVVQAEAAFTSFANGLNGTAVAATSVPPTANGSVALDVTPASTAPVFQGVNVSYGTARPAVSWTLTSGTLTASTAVVAIMAWGGQDDGGFQNGTWTIVSPAGSAASITPPALPTTLSAYTPTSGASNEGTTIVAVGGGTAMPTYASFLPMASLFQSDSDLCEIPSPVVPPLAGLGSVVVSIYSDEGGC